MGFEIEGSGDGGRNTAQVDSKKRVFVKAVSESVDAVINIESGKVWTLPFDGLNPAGAGDYVVYIKNIGDAALHLDEIALSADTAATQVELHGVTGTAAGGATLAPISSTVGSSATPSAVIQSGTDITGLTSSGIHRFIQCAVVNTEYVIEISERIRIPKGQAVALLVETATANITGTISLVEEE